MSSTSSQSEKENSTGKIMVGGLPMDREFHNQWRAVKTVQSDFAKLLLFAVFGKERAKIMRKNASPGTEKFTDEFLARASALYRQWLAQQEAMNEEGILVRVYTEPEVENFVRTFPKYLSDTAQNLQPRGANKVAEEARRLGKCPKEAVLAYNEQRKVEAASKTPSSSPGPSAATKTTKRQRRGAAGSNPSSSSALTSRIFRQSIPLSPLLPITPPQPTASTATTSTLPAPLAPLLPVSIAGSSRTLPSSSASSSTTAAFPTNRFLGSNDLMDWGEVPMNGPSATNVSNEFLS